MRYDDPSKMKRAKAAAIQILDCYSSIGTSNEETFTAGLVQMLATYPYDVIERAADPTHGIPGKVILPNLAQFKRVLDKINEDLHGIEATQARLKKRLLPGLPPHKATPEEKRYIIEGFKELLKRLDSA
jgi:hypothetical protein